MISLDGFLVLLGSNHTFSFQMSSMLWLAVETMTNGKARTVTQNTFSCILPLI
jgi:hypothetical protein